VAGTHDKGVTTADEVQFVVFRLGTQPFALGISQVERILRYEAPAAVPEAPDYLEGVIPYAGGVVPVVDLRKRLSLDAPLRDETRMVVIQLDDQNVAIVVDQVLEVLRVDSREITSPPRMVRGLAARYISGILSRAGATIVVLNAGQLLTSSERLALTEVMR
jgi:purine-binding chemotaxis protein CheW